MKRPAFGSLFSGGGLADAGAVLAGYTPLFAVECDPDAAACYRTNFGDHVHLARVQDVDPHSLPPVDVLWASPPCPDFSQARNANLPSRGEGELALACIPYLAALRPRVFFLENVPTFATKGRAVLAALRTALYRLGYTVDHSNINSAEHGVPQTRNRFILRAVLGELLPPLPAPVPWVGWYAAIEDVIDTLPASGFAAWQLARLKDHPVYGQFLLMTGNTQLARDAEHGGILPRGDADPAFSIGASLVEHGSMPRALLMTDSQDKWGDGVRHAIAPAHTLTTQATSHPMRALLIADQTNEPKEADDPAFTVTGQHGTRRSMLAGGRVVSMTPRALARFQSVPDWFVLPAKRGIACRIIGNGVPCLMVQRLLEQFTTREDAP